MCCHDVTTSPHPLTPHSSSPTTNAQAFPNSTFYPNSTFSCPRAYQTTSDVLAVSPGAFCASNVTASEFACAASCLVNLTAPLPVRDAKPRIQPSTTPRAATNRQRPMRASSARSSPPCQPAAREDRVSRLLGALTHDASLTSERPPRRPQITTADACNRFNPCSKSGLGAPLRTDCCTLRLDNSRLGHLPTGEHWRVRQGGNASKASRGGSYFLARGHDAPLVSLRRVLSVGEGLVKVCCSRRPLPVL